jgi:hypothetical protein
VQVVGPAVEHVAPPGFAVAVYPVIGLPPSEPGADQDSETFAFPGVAEFSVGALGTAFGVADRTFDAGPAPATFEAATLKL